MRCSHFDAFRFFTAPARPLNVLAPTRETQHALEQPGCLHANMDLYKWAYKLSPLVPSELVADASRWPATSARWTCGPARTTCRRWATRRSASRRPRAGPTYAAAQRGFAERAAVVRGRLIAAVQDRP